ncbi:MAG: DNA-binding protein [Acidimicrobiales bacterium]|nr:DNA-binding protein [Acidimicrobiales bacterium]
MTPRQLVTIPQAVEARPWLTERYLRRLVAERRLPYHKVAGRLLFDLADLDAHAEEHRVEPAPRGRLRLARPA